MSLMNLAAGAPSMMSWLKITVMLMISLIAILSPRTTGFLVMLPIANDEAFGPPI